MASFFKMFIYSLFSLICGTFIYEFIGISKGETLITTLITFNILLNIGHKYDILRYIGEEEEDL